MAHTLYEQSFEHDSCGIGAVVSIDGKKDSSYYINVDIYNPFTFKVKVKLNKSVPKGAFVTIFATDRSGDLTGSVTLERK